MSIFKDMLHTNLLNAYFALHSYTSQNTKHRTVRTELKCGKICSAGCGERAEAIIYLYTLD